MRATPLGPVAGAYYLDNSRIAVIEGPIGSGKSTASCLRLARHSFEQRPGPDGVGRTRWAIVRNTRPQLEDTTIKTWLNVFPEAEYGRFMSDMTQTWRFQPKDHPWPIEAEFLFRALDDAKDVQKLLSLEVTGFWLNECREIAESIVGNLSGRCRYLGGERPQTWAGWIGDTNPWDTEHYLQDRLVDNPRPGWRHFQQPGGMDEDAENLSNLSQTEESLALPFDHPARREQGRTYYRNAIEDYSDSDARVYVHAQRGRTVTGKPIYVDYSDTVHCKPFEFDRRLPLDLGFDFGRTPACTIGQEFPGGRVRIRHEIVATSMGLVKFAEEVARFLASTCKGFKIRTATGDPSGDAQDSHDQTAFDILKGVGLVVRGATTNEPTIRIETVNKALRTMDAGAPALMIHPDCKILRRACIDGYQYKRLQLAGERYADRPDKNQWSHIAEALQYHLLGLGHGRQLVRPEGRNRGPRQRYAVTD